MLDKSFSDTIPAARELFPPSLLSSSKPAVLFFTALVRLSIPFAALSEFSFVVISSSSSFLRASVLSSVVTADLLVSIPRREIAPAISPIHPRLAFKAEPKVSCFGIRKLSTVAYPAFAAVISFVATVTAGIATAIPRAIFKRVFCAGVAASNFAVTSSTTSPKAPIPLAR